MSDFSTGQNALMSRPLLAGGHRGFLGPCSPAMRSWLVGLAENLGLAAIYVACGKFGLSLAFVNASASAVWPPTGVALAALLVWGYRLWPGVFLGAVVVNITTQGSLWTTLGIAAGNTCEALLGAWLVCRFAAGLKAVERAGTFFRFVLLAGLGSTTISATFGVASLCLGGLAHWEQYYTIWLTWWLGDVVSDLIVAPLLLIWRAQGLSGLKRGQFPEAAGLLLTIVLVGRVLFLAGSHTGAASYPLTYLALPPLLWAAFRFGERGAVTAAFLMAGMALWGTLRGWGPFAARDPNTSLLFLQAFVGTASLTAVALALAVKERKAVEERHRLSQERLALMIEGSSDGVWDWDITTNEIYFSPRWKSMLGYADGEVDHHFSAWEKLLHPADRERALACLQAYLAGQTPSYELEHRLRHKDGSYRWILSRGVALRDAAGKPVRMAGSHVDLTAHKQAQEQVERAYAELSQNEAVLKAALQEVWAKNEQLQATQLELIQAAKLESVSTLAAGVAHEVMNPLQTLVMGLDYLANSLPRNKDSTALVLTDMREAIARANTIIRELLQLSAAREFELRSADLNALVERALQLIHNEVVASQITLVRKLGADLPRVALDGSRMEQVFINLFLNSLRAMSQGGVLTVTTRHRRFGLDLPLTDPARAWFKLGEPVVIAEVQDTGTGIAEADLPGVLEIALRLKPAGAGTGPGLLVARKIMDLHHAAIDIRNLPLGGVLVTLVFKAELDKKPAPARPCGRQFDET